MRVYLAGPDVFLPEPETRAAALKAVCARHGLVGVSPLDGLENEPAAWAPLSQARRIALRNEAHIRSCDALIANLTPFRGPSADVGTVFELGFARALGLALFAWSNEARPFAWRTRAFLAEAWPDRPVRRADDGWRDGEGLLVEDFALADNLMIEGAIVATGGRLVVGDVPEAARWADLGAFADCVAALAGAV